MSRQNEDDFPTIVARRSGGWLAISPPSLAIKIGVTAPTGEEARAMFTSSLASWRRNLAAEGAPAPTS